jgi:hypothetical protein
MFYCTVNNTCCEVPTIKKCLTEETTDVIGIIHRFSRLVTLLFHKWLHVRLNHKDACILTLT